MGPAFGSQIKEVIFSRVVVGDRVARGSSFRPEVQGGLKLGGHGLDRKVIPVAIKIEAAVPDLCLPVEPSLAEPALAVFEIAFFEGPPGQGSWGSGLARFQRSQRFGIEGLVVNPGLLDLAGEKDPGPAPKCLQPMRTSEDAPKASAFGTVYSA